MHSYSYLISNLTVTSNRPLSLIQSEPVAAKRDYDVTVHFHDQFLKPDFEGTAISCGRVNRHHYFYDIPNVGELYICHGREIHMAPRAEVSDEVASLFILGTGMGTVYHQRKLIPLHATVALFNRCAYAFCGHSGDGKSTLGKALLDRHIPLLTDDVACIHWQDGIPMVASEKPIIKLRPDTAKYMGLDHKQVDFPDGSRKCFLPIPHCEGCWPLKGIFILAFGDLGIQPLPMTEALGMIKAHTYRNFLVEPIWGEEAFLKEQVRLLRDVPAFLFTRPRDLNTLASMTEFLCENLAN